MWYRTGKKEFPQVGEECLVYFAYTGYSIETFSYETDEFGTSFCFSGAKGWLSDEDLLWIPISSIEGFKDLNKSIIALYPIPESYCKDPKFMKWDNPDKIFKAVMLNEEYVHPTVEEPIFLKQGAVFGVTGDWNDTYNCVQTIEGDTTGYQIPKALCSEIELSVYKAIGELGKEYGRL